MVQGPQRKTWCFSDVSLVERLATWIATKWFLIVIKKRTSWRPSGQGRGLSAANLAPMGPMRRTCVFLSFELQFYREEFLACIVTASFIDQFDTTSL